MAAKGSYHFCSGCAQFVSRTTYYRHLTPGVCPGVLDVDLNDMLYDGCEDTHVNSDFSNEDTEPAPLENDRSSPNCGDDDVDDDETEVK